MAKEKKNNIANININISKDNNKVQKRTDVLDLSAAIKPKIKRKKKKSAKFRKENNDQPNFKLKSIPGNASIGLVNREKKFIAIAGVTFFMAVVVAAWAFNLEKIYSADKISAGSALIDIDEIKDFNANLDEKMAEVKKGLDRLSEDKEPEQKTDEQLNADQEKATSSPIFTDDKNSISSTSKEFKAINLKKIIEDIKNQATGTEDMIDSAKPENDTDL
jgi:hypothetical protein